MGINSINELLRDKAPSAFQSVQLTSLHNQRVSIDSNNWIFAKYATAHRNVIFKMVDPLEEIDRDTIISEVNEQIISFLCSMSEFGVTTVWCWDGEPLADKEACRAKRKKTKDAVLLRIEEAKAELEAVHVLARTPDMIKKYKGLLVQYNVISREEMAGFKNMIDLLGFPCLQAKHEGEKLASMLTREGLAVAVWSTDTDNYALGTPMMITKFDGVDENRQPMLSVVYLSNILESLGISFEQLVDLCILLGCDFNTNMPNVGVKRSWKLIEDYKSIDGIITAEEKKPAKTKKKPIHVLRHERCRELFGYEPSDYKKGSKELDFNTTKFANQSRDVVAHYNISHWYKHLTEAVAGLRKQSRLDFSDDVPAASDQKKEPIQNKPIAKSNIPQQAKPKQSRLEIDDEPTVPSLPRQDKIPLPSK
jgi:flap endonuclease-1